MSVLQSIFEPCALLLACVVRNVLQNKLRIRRLRADKNPDKDVRTTTTETCVISYYSVEMFCTQRECRLLIYASIIPANSPGLHMSSWPAAWCSASRVRLRWVPPHASRLAPAALIPICDYCLSRLVVRESQCSFVGTSVCFPLCVRYSGRQFYRQLK